MRSEREREEELFFSLNQYQMTFTFVVVKVTKINYIRYNEIVKIQKQKQRITTYRDQPNNGAIVHTNA